MGSFYANHTVRTEGRDAVLDALGPRSAFVSPVHAGCVVVAEAGSDEQDMSVLRSLARELSSRTGVAVLAVLNHDDDILWYCLSRRGEVVDEYDSSPGYFEPDADPSPPTGGNAAELCAAFGVADPGGVEGILRRSSYDDDGYVLASDRHADLVAALGLPAFAVGFGYRSAARGQLPAGLSMQRLARTGRGATKPDSRI